MTPWTSAPWKRARGIVLAILGGVLLALSGEPWALWPCGFIALFVLIEALSTASLDKRPRVQGALIGLLFGTCVNAIALFSMIGLLEDFGHLPRPVAVFLALLAFVAQALPYAVTGALTESLVQQGIARWVAFAPSLVVGLSFTPQLFPWRPAGPQVNFLWFSQMADLGGEALIDGCMALCAAGLWQAIRGLRAVSFRERFKPALAGVLAFLLPCVYGVLRLPQVRAARDDAPALRVGIVQSNVGISQKRDEGRSEQVLHDLRSLTAQLETQGVALSVWAETAYPYQLLRSRRRQPSDERRVLGGTVRGPILLGAVTYQELEDERFLKYNSAWLLKRDGRFGDRVDKSRLLAFGEFVPFWKYLPPLQERFRSPGFMAGENDIIRLEDGTLGLLICYEDLFADLARKVVDRGATLLVNMTNDAWFGRSNEPALHDMVARLRAVETRRDLVRAVNTGVSSFTLATGESAQRTDIFTTTAFVADTRLLTERTVYTNFGDWVSWLTALGITCGIVAKRLEQRLKRAA